MEKHEIFGYNLKRYRKDLKISQTKLAELLNSNQATISHMEQGKIKNFSFDFLYSILTVTGLDIHYFFEDIPEEEIEEITKGTRFHTVPPLPKEKRVRRLPKKLFTGSRIEARDTVRSEGFAPRVDLFETVEEVINFLGGPPCDVYEVKASSLFRKYMEKIEHPMWNLYSYHEHINHDRVIGMVTYRGIR